MNAILTQVLALYVGLSANPMSLFVCYDHPGAPARAVRRYPEILCYQGEWLTLQWMDSSTPSGS